MATSVEQLTTASLKLANKYNPPIKLKKMNQHNTVEKMRRMRLSAMASLYHRTLTEHLYQDYSLDEFLSLLVDTEWESRQIESLLHRAGFRQAAAASNIDY